MAGRGVGGGDAPAVVSSATLELSDEDGLLRTFDPVAHDLDASFRLTNYTELRG